MNHAAGQPGTEGQRKQRPVRCLIAWELGSNSGHLIRCLALAQELRKQGHAVLFAVRDLRTAEQILGGEDFPFVQAPLLAQHHKQPPLPPINYSDMLLKCGWHDAAALMGSVRAWLNLFSLSRPDLVIADHAPTALLAAHIVGIPAAAVGNGFDIPPSQSPLPAFDPHKNADESSLLNADADILACINAVVDAYRKPPFMRVAELFDRAHTVLATFAELDHYGRRPGQSYAGLFYGYDKGEVVAWPEGGGPKIIAYLRANNLGAKAMLAALSNSTCRSLCVVPDAEPALIARFCNEHLAIYTRPVALAPILVEANLAIGYGSTGFTTQVLRAGVPQLILPHVIEQSLLGRRVAELGAGISLSGPIRSETECGDALQSIQSAEIYALSAKDFAKSYRDYDGSHSMQSVVRGMINWCWKKK